MVDKENGGLKRRLDKTIPTGIIFTMNCPEELAKQINYPVILEENINCYEHIMGYAEGLYSYDTYQFADYSKYNRLHQDIYSLNRNLYDDELLHQLDEFLKVNMSGLKLSQQEILDNYVRQLEELLTMVKESFVLGDLNFDGKVSAIDARIVLLATVNLQSLAGRQIYSADMDGNGEITAIDARMILQKTVEEIYE